MKILYVGNAQGFTNADKYYLIPQRLINGFTRLGHNVYVFNDRDVARHSNILRSQKRGRKAMNEALVKTCLSYKPALIVLAHCKNVTNDTLAEIRSALPDTKIIYRNVDPLSSDGNVKDIHQRVSHVDNIYVTSGGEALKQFSNNKGGVYFMPNPADTALDTVCAFDNKDADIDFLFLASFLRDQHDHRHLTAQYLLSHADGLHIKIGGAGVNEDRIFGADYYDVLGRSKMGLCVNKTSDFYLYASDRMTQYMAAGILAFIPEGPCFEDVLGDDSFISFSTDEELLDKIKHYKENESERIRIARNGYDKVREYFDTVKVCQFMIDTSFAGALSQDYRWPTERY